MRPSIIVACIALVTLVLGSLGLGYWMGEHDARTKYEAGMEFMIQNNSVDRYRMASNLPAMLEAARYDDATRVLQTWSRVQVPTIRKCKANPLCQAWSGNQMPSDAQIARLEATAPPEAAGTASAVAR